LDRASPKTQPRVRLVLASALLALAALVAPPAHAGDFDPYPRDDTLRVNHVWSMGTHNSYHLLSPLFPNGPPADLDYEHAPLDVQLEEQGVRKFELDIYWDQDLEVYRVHHENFVDAASTCPFLLECLDLLRDWSLAHPGHVPIFVFVEPKGIYSETTLSDDPLCDPPDFVVCRYDELDAEIRSVMQAPGQPDLLVTPDEVRGARATLREAILTDGWPTLRTTRGRFVFVMLDGGQDRDAYGAGQPLLAGRAMFVASAPDREDAAVMLRDDPIAQLMTIQDLVGDGFVVRTRADSPDLNPAPPTDERRDAAFASGAQIISTDHEIPAENGYVVAIPGGMPSGCNPISTAGLECTPLDVENPAALAPEPAAGDVLGAALLTTLGAWRARRSGRCARARLR
jgi:hypothetical protein